MTKDQNDTPQNGNGENVNSDTESKAEKAKRLLQMFDDNEEALCAYYISKETDVSVFLTGNAGTGKSTFIELARTMGNLCDVVAPTGIAARNIGGRTIHSMYRIPPTFLMPTDERIEAIKFSKDDVFLIYYTDYIIIDEVSMIPAPTLDCIDVILRKICKVDKPFGGKRVIFVGDPFQLPPIIRAEDKKLMTGVYKKGHFFESKVFEEMNPVRIELKKNYRQKDTLFLNTLSDIRNYKNIRSSVSLLNEHCYKGHNISPEMTAKHSIKLAFTNSVADNTNKNELEKLPGQLFKFAAKISGDFDIRTVTAERELFLKEGARVMFIKNHSKYYNGTLGTITELTDKKIVVLTDEGTLVDVEKETWKSIKKHSWKEGGKWKSEYRETGSMQQYPLKLAWAITVHKSQGLTFDNVYLMNMNMSFAAGQTYVALSRCRKIEGLRLYNKLSPLDIQIDNDILKFYKTVKSEQRVIGLLDQIMAQREEEKKWNLEENIVDTLPG